MFNFVSLCGLQTKKFGDLDLKRTLFAVGCRFSLTRPNSSLCGQRELAIGLQLQQKDQNGIAISHCCNQVGAKGAAYPQILDGKY